MLLFAVSLALDACKGCSNDPIPEGPFAAIQLVDGYLGACDVGGSSSFHVHVVVDKYTAGSYEGVHYENEWDIDSTELVFYEIPVPSSGQYQITMTLQSNDCNPCCTGSCGTEGGYPLFETATGVVDATPSGNFFTLVPHMQDCY